MIKPTAEQSRADRLRVVLGWALVVFGLLAVLILGAMYGYNKTTIWVAGILLIVSGVFIAKSVELANFLNDILRF